MLLIKVHLCTWKAKSWYFCFSFGPRAYHHSPRILLTVLLSWFGCRWCTNARWRLLKIIKAFIGRLMWSFSLWKSLQETCRDITSYFSQRNLKKLHLLLQAVNGLPFQGCSYRHLWVVRWGTECAFLLVMWIGAALVQLQGGSWWKRKKNRPPFVIFIRYFPRRQYTCADLCLSPSYSSYHEFVS